MAPSAAGYQKDEKVLCFHHELLYEAKILDIRQEDGEYEYKIHYKGWKNTWDDWVPQDRLRKHTEENFELARMLKREIEQIRSSGRSATEKKPTATKKRAAGDGSTRASENLSPTPQVAAKKRGRDLETEKEDIYRSKPQIDFLIPDALKSILVDDWENVTKNLQLTKVPSDVPANIVLDEWAAYEREKREASGGELDVLEETVQAFKAYFNRALGKLLLYSFERTQYKTVYSRTQRAGDALEGKRMGDIYGPEHLLRMLTQMPEFCANTNIDRQSAMRLKEELGRLALFLAKPESLRRYFSTPYESVSSGYKTKAN